VSPGPSVTVHEQPDEEPAPVKRIVITEDSVQAHGFDSIYELIGFIHLKCRPDVLQTTVINAMREKNGGGR